MLWPDHEKPASYAIAGLIHTEGTLTFKLTGEMELQVRKRSME